ncbi:DNA translocase FtsK [Bacillus sinesaloumensis]|uniref:DNA translocase FtsK n=1 Tax=Litchfieldia sinesaloumensis TaxID=1926280 RepID=UPI001F2E4802|nr:DNA translocase FtsK [Bacillus sinesaloumensis]
MNWIKKLLQKLQTDDDDPIEIKTTQIRQNKHVEARVTYEYPKGNFRFPVIPDQEKQQKEKVQTRQSRTSNPKTYSKPKAYSNPKPTVKVQEKQPFRLTETPSPVYGLGKPTPKEKEKIVEYELPTTPIADTESIAEVWNEVQEEVAATIQVTEQIEPKLHDVTREETQRKVAIFAEQLIKEEDSEHVNEIHETIKNTNTIVDTSVLRESTDVELQPNETKTEEQPHPTVEIETVQEVQEVDEKETMEQPVEQDEAQVNEVEKSTEHTTSNSQRRRSNIPFNVMMFKKDKQRLAERESKRITEPGQVNKETQIQHELPEQPVQECELIQHDPVVEQETQLKQEEDIKHQGYSFPGLSYLNAPPAEQHTDDQWLIEQRDILDQTLHNFKVRAKVVNVTQGPAVTRFEVHPEPGVKVNKITNLSDDIKLSLAARDIRIEAPIPGKNTIGIEVPNRQSKPVLLKEIIESPEFITNKSPLTVAMGLDISGKPIVTDLQKMPHGLIAGATGSGKSVCINAMLVSLLYKASPDEVKLLLIDPKMVELAPYNHIPHLVSPVITDVKAATASLKWAVEEMERRYELFAHTGVRDIGRYNEMVKKHDEKSGKLPYLVIIIDELADLMMVAPGEVEDSICRIAQKARACGIHLILATQRPSVDVITGLIKANIPTRIAFSVSSQVDSRTIIDSSGAEKLLGRGDMLFLENGSSKPIRVQGNFVTDEEIEAVVGFAKSEMKPSYMFQQEELLKKASITADEDELFIEACEFVLEHGAASTSSVQRRFRIGYNRAARLIDMMEEQGIISESRGSKPREVLITEEDLAEIHEG